MRDLRVTLVQTMLHWEDASANRDMFTEKLASIGATDLIVLPEMFNTGFTMESELFAETMDGPTVEWMRGTAKKQGAAIYGSAIIKEGGSCYNRGIFVMPDGMIVHYDKRHLFRMAGEHMHYSAGSERVVVDLNGWKILLQVCYDLRFPVFSRNRNDYDLVIYVANWPEARRHAWSSLLIARAIENLSYCIGVNRVGMDGKGIHYTGDSVVIDPRGSVIGSCGTATECIMQTTLSHSGILEYRKKFPAHLDADDLSLHI